MQRHKPNCICLDYEVVTCFGSDIVETTTYPPSEEGGKHKFIELHVWQRFLPNNYHDIFTSL